LSSGETRGQIEGHEQEGTAWFPPVTLLPGASKGASADERLFPSFPRKGVAVGGGMVQQLLKENVAVQAGILVPSAVAM
jgi:hypothetical protein